MDHSLALTLSNVFKTASSLYPAVHVASVQTPDHERVLETRSVCKRLHECWSGIRRGAAVFLWQRFTARLTVCGCYEFGVCYDNDLKFGDSFMFPSLWFTTRKRCVTCTIISCTYPVLITTTKRANARLGVCLVNCLSVWCGIYIRFAHAGFVTLFACLEAQDESKTMKCFTDAEI